MASTARIFSSVSIDRQLRAALVRRLTVDHAERPFSPGDPRETVVRVGRHLGDLGLQAVRIRGTVTVTGVEVDHVWLAVGSPGTDGWVLDASLPLREPAFVGALAGYVAGMISGAELAAAALGMGIEQRVLGVFPPSATYRGQPYWSTRSN
ncbi:hypothetical protein BH23ACT9_BH23ACT9_08470 [soil metagenome]